MIKQEVKANTPSVQELIAERKQKNNISRVLEKIMPKVLLITAILSVLTTLGILFTLIIETFTFFERVNIKLKSNCLKIQVWKNSS